MAAEKASLLFYCKAGCHIITMMALNSYIAELCSSTHKYKKL